MVDPIINQAAQAATEKAGQQGGQPPRQVDAQEQAKFEDALNRPQENQSPQPGDPGQIQHAEQANSKSYQQAMLDGIQNLQQGFEQRGAKIEADMARAAADKEISPMELMKTQMDLVKMELEMQAATKGADKASNDVQTLMNRSN